MARHIRWTWLLGAMLAAVGATRVWADETGDDQGARKMRAAMMVAACRTCHAMDKDHAKLTDVTRCCDNHCAGCHEDMDKHHPVGSEVKDRNQVHPALPLLSGDKLGCISCHDIAARRTDTKSWKSQSLYARLFQGQTVYKTYLLRINNSSGKLCKVCH